MHYFAYGERFSLVQKNVNQISVFPSKFVLAFNTQLKIKFFPCCRKIARHILLRHARITIEATLNVKVSGTESRKGWKVQSQQQCSVAFCNASSLSEHYVRRERWEKEKEKGECYRTLSSTTTTMWMSRFSSLVRLLPLLILIILVTLSGLSTAATSAVSRQNPVTRDHQDKARHHRRQGRTMPHAPRHQKRRGRRFHPGIRLPRDASC